MNKRCTLWLITSMSFMSFLVNTPAIKSFDRNTLVQHLENLPTTTYTVVQSRPLYSVSLLLALRSFMRSDPYCPLSTFFWISSGTGLYGLTRDIVMQLKPVLTTVGSFFNTYRRVPVEPAAQQPATPSHALQQSRINTVLTILNQEIPLRNHWVQNLPQHITDHLLNDAQDLLNTRHPSNILQSYFITYLGISPAECTLTDTDFRRAVHAIEQGNQFAQDIIAWFDGYQEIAHTIHEEITMQSARAQSTLGLGADKLVSNYRRSPRPPRSPGITEESDESSRPLYLAHSPEELRV